MKNGLKNFLRGIGQLAAAIIVCVIFICIAKFILRDVFYNYCSPSDTNLDYSDWANIFVTTVTISSVVCILFNALLVLLGAFAMGPFVTTKGWIFGLLFSLAAGVVAAVIFSVLYPDETFCFTIACAVIVLEWVFAFFIGSFFGDRFYKLQYNPVLGFFNKKK